MKISDVLQKNILAILSIARYAPSVHNAQPWLVSVLGDCLLVDIDPAHQLGDGDPTGRETMISIGIFCESLGIAVSTVGLKLQSVALDNKTARLAFSASTIADDAAVDLLQKRSSDRSIYKPAAVETGLLKTLQECNIAGKTTIHTSTDSAIIAQVADLTSHAIGVALSSPGFRHELSEYLVVPGSNKQRGIATRSLYINPVIARLEPFMLRQGINLGAEARLELQRWLSASALVLITAPGDIPKYWLEVGRSYLRVSLAIEAAGLSQATSGAIVEASNYHEDVEESLGTSERILAVIRIGQGSPKRYYSPRVSADALLKSQTT